MLDDVMTHCSEPRRPADLRTTSAELLRTRCGAGLEGYRNARTPQLCWGVRGLVSVRRCPTFPPWWVVSSALAGLASGFGMGPGVSLSLWPP
jgi:hypothetical protein